jgi:D-alanine-D-alanine ligase
MAKKMKVLLLIDIQFEAEPGYEFEEELKDPYFATYAKALRSLKKKGHDVKVLGIFKKLDPLFEEVKKDRPDIIVNQADCFNDKSHLDKNIAWVLEMLGVPFTGASPTSLLICNNKALNKKILRYHRIHVPNFQTYYSDRKIKVLKKLKLPCVVKPLAEEASRGISLASVVDTEAALIERVKFIHESMKQDAIAEEYIEGREFYIGIFGHKRLTVLPPREMIFGNLPDDEPRIATYKAKWDKEYQKRWKIDNVPAKNLDEALLKKVSDMCKRAYRALNMKCYARFDIRITPEGKIYIIEPNANPSLAPDDEFVLAAKKYGLSYDQLLDRLMQLALSRG